MTADEYSAYSLSHAVFIYKRSHDANMFYAHACVLIAWECNRGADDSCRGGCDLVYRLSE